MSSKRFPNLFSSLPVGTHTYKNRIIAIGAKHCKDVATVVAGGGSSFAIRRQAEGILASGATDAVLVVHAQRFSQFPVNDQIKYFAHAGSNLEWGIPYG
jgi:hypothetical protein